MQIDDELRQVFVAESRDLLEQLEQALLAAEGREASSGAVLQVLRLVHNLKGNASTVGFVAPAEVAHTLEDLLAGAPRLEPDRISLSLEAVDALRRLVDQAATGEPALGPRERELLERLTRGQAGAPAAPAPLHQEQTLRIPLSTLDRLLTLTGEVLVARARLGATLVGLPAEQAGRAREAHEEADALFTELQAELMRARMVPIGPVFRQLARAVRDGAQALSKQARLETEGEREEIDAALVARVRDPLVHLVRNALDHGIEPPEARRAAGKDPCATLRLSARRESGQVVVEVSDDGAGFSAARIARRAAELGLHPDPAQLPEAQLLEFVFHPGFSTRTEVTALSGRGVGMDVVRQSVESLLGSVSIESREGRGATVRLRLPLSVAIIDGFGVSVGPQIYVLPAADVLQCVALDPARAGQEPGVLAHEGRALPCLRLREALGLPGAPAARESVAVVRQGEARVGLVVDGLLGRRQTVVKPLGRLFRGLRGISGTAIESSGRVSLVLDLPQLLADLPRPTP